MLRFDGIIIDGRAAGEVNWNPFAIGHKINHCPPGAEPNVLNVRDVWNVLDCCNPYSLLCSYHSNLKGIPSLPATISQKSCGSMSPTNMQKSPQYLALQTSSILHFA